MDGDGMFILGDAFTATLNRDAANKAALYQSAMYQPPPPEDSQALAKPKCCKQYLILGAVAIGGYFLWRQMRKR